MFSSDIGKLKVFVSGAKNFIGQSLARAFVQAGHRVVVCSDPSRRADGLAALMKNCDVVINSPEWSNTKKDVHDLSRLITASVEAGVDRFIQIGRLDVFRATGRMLISERSPLPRTRKKHKNYARTEDMLFTAHENGCFRGTLLRVPYVYGENEKDFLPDFLNAIQTRRFSLIGDGSAYLETLSVENLVEAVARVIETPRSAGRLYHVTDGQPVTQNYMVKLAAREAGVKVEKNQSVFGAWMKTMLACLGAQKGVCSFLNFSRFRFLTGGPATTIGRASGEIGYFPRLAFTEAFTDAVRAQLARQRPVALTPVNRAA